MKFNVFTKNLAVIALICLFVASASAQPRRERRSAEERAKNQTEQLDKSLTLTAEQKTKIEAVNLELAKKADKMMENSGDREKMRAQMQEQETSRNAKYKEILTAEQYAKYTKEREERRREAGSRTGRGARGEGNAPAPPATKPAK